MSKRATLEQFVGNEAFNQFEDELAKREYENKTANNDERKQQDEEYNQTIKNVEEYKSSLNTVESEQNPYVYEENSQETVSQNEDEGTDEELLASKADKYSTKGLIFVHDNDRYKKESWEMTPEEQEEARLKAKEEQQSAKAASSEEPVKKSKRKSRRESKQEEVNATRQSTSSQQQQLLPVLPAAQQQVQKPKTYNGVELLPLDTIKTPERQFRKNGYSIFAE